MLDPQFRDTPWKFRIKLGYGFGNSKMRPYQFFMDYLGYFSG